MCSSIDGSTPESLESLNNWITYMRMSFYTLHMVSFWKGQGNIWHALGPQEIQTRLKSCPHILGRESATHRDVACLLRTPEHKYPLALWDIGSAAPPGLAEKRWRGVLVTIRANPDLVRPPVRSRVMSETCLTPWTRCTIHATRLWSQRSVKRPDIKSDYAVYVLAF